jgi:capsular polysaccharide biosynthesis protein
MEEIDLKELFRFFIKKIYIVIGFTLVFMIVGFIYFKEFQTPLYHSSSTVILVSEKQKTDSTEYNLNHQLVTTYSQIIKNSDILNTVINNLHLDISKSELANNINVTAIDNTEIIKIEVSSASSEEAKIIATEVTNTFISKVNDIYKLQNVTVLAKPKLETVPYNKATTKYTILSSMVGLLVGVGIIFIKFYFDTTIKSVDDIENKVKLTVLGRVEKVG